MIPRPNWRSSSSTRRWSVVPFDRKIHLSSTSDNSLLPPPWNGACSIHSLSWWTWIRLPFQTVKIPHTFPAKDSSALGIFDPSFRTAFQKRRTWPSCWSIFQWKDMSSPCLLSFPRASIGNIGQRHTPDSTCEHGYTFPLRWSRSGLDSECLGF